MFAKLAIALSLAAALLGSVPVVSLWARQEAFLFPVRHNDETVSAAGVWRVGHVEVPGSGRIAFRFADEPGNPSAPVLLFLHGNGSSTRFGSNETAPLAIAGIPVVSAEFPGYSGNPGRPSEASINATATATAAWARARWPHRRLAVMGESLGSAPAVHLAVQGDADLLVLDSAFTSVTEMIRLQVPWLPVVRVLNRHPMENLAAIQAASRPLPPTLVMISAEDPIVPTTMGERLAAAIPGSAILRSAWRGHAVLHGDPPSVSVLMEWLTRSRPATP